MHSSSASSACVAWTRHQRSSISDMVDEPVHRSSPAPAQTVFHFFRLLCDMDMHGVGTGQTDHRRELFGSHRSQAMGRDADDRIIKRGQPLAGCGRQVAQIVDVGDEPRLTRVGRGAAEAGMRVKDGEKRQADPGCAAAAAMPLAISAGSENSRPPRSWCT